MRDKSIQPRYTPDAEGVSPTPSDRKGADTLKALARKVLKSGVSAVSPLGSDTPIHPQPKVDTAAIHPRYTEPEKPLMENSAEVVSVDEAALAELTEEREAIQHADLHDRLEAHGLRIAIDRGTGNAHLLLVADDAFRVEGCATIFRAHEIHLNEEQRADLTESLNYLESIENRRQS